MTREEALKYWEWHLERAEERSDPHWEASERKAHREYIDAMRFAIEALTNTDSDLISREDAIKAIAEMGFVDEEDGRCHDWDENIAYAKDVLSDVPSATVPGWIPCSERLPEEINIYLCCNIVGDIYMHRWTMPFYFKKEGAWMDMYDDWPEEITDVVAWMPLPEPYKAESEDKE